MLIFLIPGWMGEFFHFKFVFEIGEEEAEWSKKEVEYSEDNFWLENADFMGNAFPALPEPFEDFHVLLSLTQNKV